MSAVALRMVTWKEWVSFRAGNSAGPNPQNGGSAVQLNSRPASDKGSPRSFVNMRDDYSLLSPAKEKPEKGKEKKRKKQKKENKEARSLPER